MRGRSRGISKSVLACLAILGGAGMGGLAAGYNARAGLSAQPAASSTVVADAARADMARGDMALADLAPSDSVNLRFPADWADAEVEPVSKMLTLASADSSIALFSPRPTYAATDADAPVMVESTPKPRLPQRPPPKGVLPPQGPSLPSLGTTTCSTIRRSPASRRGST